MKKTLSISILTIIAITSNALATQTRPHRISDVVAILEESPEYTEIAIKSIALARATKSPSPTLNQTPNPKLPSITLDPRSRTNLNANTANLLAIGFDADGNAIPESFADVQQMLRTNFPIECGSVTWQHAVKLTSGMSYTKPSESDAAMKTLTSFCH